MTLTCKATPRIIVLEKRLAEFIHTPVHLWESERTRSLYGKAEIEGVEVELIGDIVHLGVTPVTGVKGEWNPAIDLGNRHC